MNKIVSDRFPELISGFITGSPIFSVLFDDDFNINIFQCPDEKKYGFTTRISNLRQVLAPSALNILSELKDNVLYGANGQNPVKRELKFLNGHTSEFLISMFSAESSSIRGTKYLLILIPEEDAVAPDLSELDYPELFRIIKDEVITELIDSVMSSYPFTLLGKIRFQDHINALGYGILVTDSDNRIISANRIFTNLLGYDNPKGIEGKSLEEANKNHADSSEFKSVIFSTSAVQKNINIGAGEITLFTIPVRDYKKDFIARLIFSSENAIIETEKKSLGIISLLQNVQVPAAIIDKSGNISECTRSFAEKFGIIKNNSIYGILISDDSKIDFNSFVSSDSSLSHIKFLSEKENLTDLYLLKIFSELNEFVILVLADEYRQEEETLEEILKNKGPMYQIIIQNNPEPVFVYDTENLRFLDVNEKALQLYGYTRNEFLNLDVTDLYSPEDIQTILESSNLSEGNYTGPYRHRKKDGKVINVEIAKSLFTYEGKEAHYNIVNDISKRLAKDLQLNIYQSMIEASDNLCFLLDMTGFITNVNPAVESVLGYSRSEMMGNNILSFVDDSNRSFFTRRNSTGIKEKVIFRAANGDALECTTVLSLYYDIDGNLDTMSVTASPKQQVVEVVVEKPVEIEKIITKEVIVEKEVPSKSKNHGLPTSLGIDPEQMKFVFHEILSPFNVIVGFLNEVKDSIISPSDDQKEAFSYIDENKAKLLYTMDSISEYAMIEQDLAATSNSKIRLKDIIRAIQLDYETSNNPYKKSLELTRITEFVSLETDKEKIKNLLYLFVKLASNLTSEPKIYLSAYEYDSSHIVITLKDDLIGITEKFNENLNTLFNFNDVMTLRAHDLSRFSLAAFRRLYESVNGKIETITKSGAAFEFGLVIPLRAYFRVEAPSSSDKTDFSGMDHIGEFTRKEEKVFSSKEKVKPAPPSVSEEELGKKYGFATEEDEDRFFKDNLGFTSDFERSFEESLRERERKYNESVQHPKTTAEKFDFSAFKKPGVKSEPPLFSDESNPAEDIIAKNFNADLFKIDKSRTRSEETPAREQAREVPPALDRDTRPAESRNFDLGFNKPFESKPADTNRDILIPKTPVSGSEPPKDFRVPAETQQKGGINLANLSCLYIEDQLDSQILFKVQMKDLKEIKFAQSFEDAEPLLDEHDFDFIVMDINLQGEYNGLDALKIIRTMPRFEKTPIIAVTAYVLPGDKDKFIALGFDDFISKPIFKNKMKEVLEKIF